VAAVPPRELRDRLASFTAGVGADGLRALPAEQLHVTVVFLGDVVDTAIAALAAEMAAVTASEPAFELGVVSARPAPERRPRMLWAVLGASEPLIRISRSLHETARQAAPDRAKPLRGSPHITLARYRRPLPELEAMELPLEERRFDVTELHLIRSQLSQQGARYETVSALPLAPA
jgi:2'-5' RNA ligase